MVGRILLILLLVLIVLIFFVPYGVDVSYAEGELRAGLQAGPVRIGLYPLPAWLRKLLAKKKAGKASDQSQAESPEEKPEALDKKEKIPRKRELDIDTVLALLKMGVHAIRRFFRSFTVNLFRLHLLVASNDPYNTAMAYAAVCTAVEALPALGGGVLRVRRRDVQIGSDFLSDKPKIALRITLTLQLFRLVHLAVALAAEFIAFKLKNRASKAAAASERKADNGREQIQ